MRPILILLLALMAQPASAAWVKVYENDTSMFYVDPASIRKNGVLVSAWGIVNLKTQEPDGALSKRALVEYDCKATRLRVLTIAAFSGPMATGKLLATESKPGDWRPIESESFFGKLVTSKRICFTGNPGFGHLQTRALT